MDYYNTTIDPPRLRPHAALSHCTVAPHPQISFMLRSSAPAVDTPSTPLPLPLPLLAHPARSSQTSCHAQVSVVHTIAKKFRCRFTSVIGLIMQLPPARSVISAVSTLEHAPAHSRAHARDKSGPPQCTLSMACSLDLFSQLQSRPRYIQNPNITGSFHVPVSVSFSYAYDLVVERHLSTYPILPLLLPLLVPDFHHPASCSFGPTRTPVDTLLDFVPSSFGFSSMVLALVSVLQFLFPLPFCLSAFRLPSRCRTNIFLACWQLDAG